MATEVKRTDCDFLERTFPNVWPMTSREFHTDAHARADLIASHLKDNVTMQIFQEAIRFNRHLFKDKVVLVLNAGIDLCFSLWAAKYGAAHVYAVDNSKAVDYVNAIIEPNNMCGKITVFKGRIQEIELPVENVDVILSNWMGYALLIEDKIQSVIYARDKWLKETGTIFPDCADLLIAGVQNSKNKNQRIDWWRDVQSFNMNAIRKDASIEPAFQKIDPNEVLTMPVKIWTVNLKKITQKELHFKKSFYIEITNGGCLEGLLTYFDVRFSRSHVPVQFSTSPWAPYTKWLQTVFYFDEPISVNVGERYHGGLKMRRALLKDGSFATKTYMEFYSGLRHNLSLVFNRSWLCKWVYVDHTDGTVTASGENEAGFNLKDNTSVSNKKSVIDKGTPKPQYDKSSTKSQDDKHKPIGTLTKSHKVVASSSDTNHVNCVDVRQSKLLAAINKAGNNKDAQFLKLPVLQQANGKSSNSKTSSVIEMKNSYINQNANFESYSYQLKSKQDFTISKQTNDSTLNKATFCVVQKSKQKNQLYSKVNDKPNSNLPPKVLQISKTEKSKKKYSNQDLNNSKKVMKSAVNDFLVASSDELKTPEKSQISKQRRKSFKK